MKTTILLIHDCMEFVLTKHRACIRKASVIMSSPQCNQDEDQHTVTDVKQEHNEEQPAPTHQSTPRQDGTHEQETDLPSTLRRMETKMETTNENTIESTRTFATAWEIVPFSLPKTRITIAVLEDLAVRVERMEARDRGKGNLLHATAHTGPLQPKPVSQVRRAQSPQPSSSAIPAILKDCIFCGGHHWATDCDRFTTLTARRNRVYELQRCERCLTPNNHLVTACPAKSSCFYCKRANRTAEMTKHHSAFCVYQFEM
ncbi:hypothetical protein Aduo_016471 [Ancylostoma duodenale]